MLSFQTAVLAAVLLLRDILLALKCPSFEKLIELKNIGDFLLLANFLLLAVYLPQLPLP